MKQNHRATSFDIELLAKEMRERALLIEGNPNLNEGSLKTSAQIKAEKERKEKALEEFKALYFNAGRWAAGAKDWSARKAFEKVNRIQAN